MNDLSFATGEVAAMLGVSPHTVRAWERRYLALKPARSASGQRRYTLDDVALLRQIKHERHAHHLSLRMATMAAQGLITVGEEDSGPDLDAAPPQTIADPIQLVPNLISEVVLVVDQNGRLGWANTAFARFADQLPSRMLGLKFLDFVDPYDRAKAVQTYSPPFLRRRRWELNLRGARRRALFAFDSCPVSADGESLVVLVGAEQSGETAAHAVEDPPGVTPAVSLVPPPLRVLLTGTPDPERAAHLVQSWLDPLSIGIALLSATRPLTCLMSNELFQTQIAGQRHSIEGRQLSELLPAEASNPIGSAGQQAVRSGEPQMIGGWLSGQSPDGPAWDLELLPVTDSASTVTHLLVTTSPSRLLAKVPPKLERLVDGIQAMEAEDESPGVLDLARRCGQELFAGATMLVARAVSAGSGLHLESPLQDPAEGLGGEAKRVRWELMLGAARSRAPIEISWEGSAGPETMRIVPLISLSANPGTRPVLGVLGLNRDGLDPFSPADRWLLAELTDRVAAALDRIDRSQVA